ncbi:DUF2141 domain-containing protein [Stieleria sp. ICT_E10.1]|uniref:DUF2141 domain-containing protein n=1 Tax=Stieleria sedimenti TaxID=2976331 RepID=UPI00217F6BCC|nr:DUF2141 domain-containing protein [Stieleria sedimenti]MCS7468918.1 DUF2141 domain-containing protein [Stieleria sedimenti]
MPVQNDKLPFRSPNEKGRYRRAWKESHGNLLLAFAGVIFLIGLAMIWASPPDTSEFDVDLGAVANTDQVPSLPPNVILIRVATSQLDSTGPIRIAVYDSAENFGNPDRAIIKDSLVPIDGFVVWEIQLSILPEQFAIAAYHDLDDNGELNRALFNAPVEPYGFSNNARSLVGPPTYEQTIMERPSESTAIEIRVY